MTTLTTGIRLPSRRFAVSAALLFRFYVDLRSGSRRDDVGFRHLRSTLSNNGGRCIEASTLLSLSLSLSASSSSRKQRRGVDGQAVARDTKSIDRVKLRRSMQPTGRTPRRERPCDRDAEGIYSDVSYCDDPGSATLRYVTIFKVPK